MIGTQVLPRAGPAQRLCVSNELFDEVTLCVDRRKVTPACGPGAADLRFCVSSGPFDQDACGWIGTQVVPRTGLVAAGERLCVSNETLTK